MREVGDCMQSVLFARTATEFFGDVAFVEAVVSGQNRSFAVLALLERPGLGIDEFLQSGKQVRLAPNLARARRFLFFARMREEDLL